MNPKLHKAVQAMKHRWRDGQPARDLRRMTEGPWPVGHREEAAIAALIALRGEKCQICHRKPSQTVGSLVLDFEPSRRFIRGLLCGRCRKMLTAARQSPKLLALALEYLQDTLPAGFQLLDDESSSGSRSPRLKKGTSPTPRRATYPCTPAVISLNPQPLTHKETQTAPDVKFRSLNEIINDWNNEASASRTALRSARKLRRAQ